MNIKTFFGQFLILTGAKCVEGSVKDPAGEGLEYHVVGQIRTKPGRGDRLVYLKLQIQE